MNRIWTWVILLRLLLSTVGASIITVYCAFVSTNVIIVIIKRQVFRVWGNKKASPLQSTRKRRRTVVTIECNYNWRALVFCKITVQIERVGGGGGGARKELLSDKTRIKFKVDLTTISSTRSYYYYDAAVYNIKNCSQWAAHKALINFYDSRLVTVLVSWALAFHSSWAWPMTMGVRNWLLDH